MEKLVFILSLSFFTALPCLAEESNLENFTYPTHQCDDKPLKPTQPSRLSSFKEIEDYNNAIIEYNIDVAAYNKNIKRYKVCINQYISNGNKDINTIKKELNKALKEARIR